jgi:serine-type D-Ala-D-Ala carboxypeptidase/endopeptidase
MKKIFLVLVLFLLFWYLPAQTIELINGTKVSADSVQKKIEHVIKQANVSGLAVSIFNKDEVIYSKTFGLRDVQKNLALTENSILYAASFSKAVFAFVVMQCVDKKILDLDKPLAEYLDKDVTEYEFNSPTKGYKDLRNDTRWKKITARMCLNHSTGFPNWRWFEEDETLKIRFEPGTRYAYSGEGMYLLQFVLEQITKKDYETMAQEMVFKPFGMSNTSQLWQTKFDSAVCYGHNAKGESYRLNKPKTAKGTGSMSTTLSDFNKFLTAFVKGERLTKMSFAEMTKSQIRIRSKKQFGPLSMVDSTGNDNIQLSYGLGLGLFMTPYGKAFFKEGHDEGWGHYFVFFPEKKIGMVMMTNNDNGESIFKELLEYCIGDRFTPWQWENYIPYSSK